MARRSNRNRNRGGRPGRHGRRFSDFPFPDINFPPPGTVDPGLEAQVRQSQRGLLDTLQDIHVQNRQGRQDTRTGRRIARRGARRSLADLGYQRGGTQLSFARDLQDLALARQRGDEDYGLALQTLTRKYANLASSQTQSANARGSLEGGFAAASARKRAANQQFEQQPIDIEHQRDVQDIAQREGRTREDFARTMGRYDVLGGRTRQDLHTQLRQAQRELHRSLRANRLRRSRAIREQGLFALDQASQSWYAAHQADPTLRFRTPSQLRQGGP